MLKFAVVLALATAAAAPVACGDDGSPATTPRAVSPSAVAPAAVATSDGNARGIPALQGEIQNDQGLRYIDEKAGDGAQPKSGQHVQVHYTGWLANGTKFDSSRDRGTPIDFVLGAGQVIRGWDIGIASMKVGGKRRLIVSPELGYGAGGRGPIPGNATLIFDVELVSVGP